MVSHVSYVDLIVDHIGQLCVIPAYQGGPQRGERFGDLGVINDAAVAVRSGRIVAAGRHDLIRGEYAALNVIDAENRLVTPGLVDAHTHLIWSGDRASEFELRLMGATYQEIAAAGGGINRTVRETRAASLADLFEGAEARLNVALRHGTTTLECKTGYGLNQETEIAMLSAIALLDSEHPVDVVPTFLGAHDIPPEYSDNPDAYVDLLVDHILPAVAVWKSKHWDKPLYCDAFCEQGVFTVAQTRRIFEKALLCGLRLRLHADEFVSLGGVRLAVEMNAASVDHLLVTTPEDARLLGASNTAAVLLPATPFGLGIANTAPAKLLYESGAIIALGSDCNPGTAWCENMQMSLALACRSLKLTPAQALAAATINSAFALDRGDLVGSLEPGKRADLVIWDVPDYRHLAYRFGTNLAHTVIKDGQVVYPPTT